MLRLGALALNWGNGLEIDVLDYLVLGQQYSFADPWSASYREPLWRGLVHLTGAPFDYSPNAVRAFTTAISILTLPVVWVLLRRLERSGHISRRAGVIALGIVAFSPQLVHQAPRGFREDLCLLLFLFVAFPLVTRIKSRSTAAVAAVAIGLLSVVRLELAVFALALCLAFACARRLSFMAPALGAVLLVALALPWLVANGRRHGEFSYTSKIHSTYYWKQDQPESVRARFAVPVGSDPPVHLSWSEYYLDYLGPSESARRVVLGYPRVLAKLAASQVVPHAAATSVLGRDQDEGPWIAMFVVAATLLALAVAIPLLRLWKARRKEPTFWTSLLLLLLVLAPYAPLARYFEMRLLVFAVPLLALTVGVGVDRSLRLRHREAALDTSRAPGYEART